MSNGARPYPSLKVLAESNESLRSQGGNPWVYSAAGRIQLVTGEGARRQLSTLLPMRLDTGAFVSLIPEEWLGGQQLRRFFRLSSASTPFRTAAGQGQGNLAVGLQAVFA